MFKSLAAFVLLLVGCAFPAEVFRNAAFQCGIPKHANTLLIVNGVDAKISDWPWHAAIWLHLGDAPPEYACGGTMISERFVVTAAHCTLDPDEPDQLPMMSVQMGVNAIGSPEGTVYHVEEIHRHEGFSQKQLWNDIAILELNSTVEFTDFILPICVSRRTEIKPGKVGAVVGWGVTENDIPSTKLKLTKLPVIDDLECKRKEPELYGRVLNEKIFCAGYTNGTSACNGDSGGGIVFERGDAWYLGGVVSFTKTRDGSHLCQTSTYSAFTKVTAYLDWIEKITNMNFNQEYGIEKVVPCSAPSEPNGVCVPIQQCHDVFDVLRSPLLSLETADELRQKVCQLHGVRRSVCCRQDQVEPIQIHRNAILLEKECGVPMISEPTVTATRAKVLEFPWVAMIRSSQATPDHDPYCTGSLINNRYVLASAGCLKAKERRDLDYVRLGERTVGESLDCDAVTDPQSGTIKEQCADPPLDVKLVLPFIYHHMANKPFRVNDIALVRLQEKVQFADHIQPICLPIWDSLRRNLPKEFIANLFEVTPTTQGAFVLELYKTRSEFTPAAACEERFEDFGYTPWVTESTFCALAQGPSYVCTPHIGAPLVAMVAQDDDSTKTIRRAVLYGMAMVGPSNCTIAAAMPKIYTSVAFHMDWILENIRP